MKVLNKCSRCNESLDLSACGTLRSFIVINDDTANKPPIKKERYLLCDFCTSKLKDWIKAS